MPIIAVAAAGFALASGGAAAIGAVIAGTATLATTFAAVATIGAVVSAVGAVTGDKTLSTIGMVVGGIGGVGALASSAGLFGASATTDSLFGPTTSAATVGDAAPAALNSAASGQIDNAGSLINGTTSNAMSGFMPGDVTSAALPDIGAASTSTVGADVIDSLSGAVKPLANASAALPDAGIGVENATVTATKVATDPLAATASAASALPSPAAVSAPVAGSSAAPTAPTVMKNGVPDVRIPGNTYTGADGKTYTSNGTQWTPASEGGVWNFLKTAGGGALGMGVLQAGGAFLQGATDELKPAQVAAYQAQAAANNASAAVTQKQADNMNSNIPVARRTAVTGAPGGFINNQPAGAGA